MVAGMIQTLIIRRFGTVEEKTLRFFSGVNRLSESAELIFSCLERLFYGGSQAPFWVSAEFSHPFGF
ncbi:MAG: hypothetical protein MJ078_02060, partial [Clostridia bacterium]|nr:hypothetical protein [Clostridia bacterium]